MPFLILSISIFLLYGIEPSGDYYRYLEWAEAAVSGNINKLNPEFTSPKGIPLSQWQQGAGMLLALGKLAPENFLALSHNAHLIGWICSLVFSYSFAKVIFHFSKENFTLAFFGFGIAFTGTHTGFYTLIITSESLAFCFLAVFFLWILKWDRWKPFDFAVVGMATAMVLTIKLVFALYLLPALLFVFYLNLQKNKFEVSPKFISNFFFLLIPILVALLEIGIVNQWMTGSYFHSPYSFSYKGFNSLDWSRPEFFAILFHPLHGLFIYHPIYALGIFALIYLLVKTKEKLERSIYLTVLTTIFFHLYLQASWYGWWLGTGSFGMRGMSTISIILVPILIRAINLDLNKNPFLSLVWIILSFLSCCWSYLLLCQGATNFYSYQEFIGSILNNPGLATNIQNIIIYILITGGFWGFLNKTNLKKNEDLPNYICQLFSIFLFGLTLYYIVSLFFVNVLPSLNLKTNSPNIKIIITTAKIAFILGASWILHSFLNKNLNLNFPLFPNKHLIHIYITFVFIGSTLFFFNLYQNTDSLIRTFSKKSIKRQNPTSIHWTEINETYKEYLRIEGFDDAKARLKSFIDTNGQTYLKKIPDF